MSIPTTFWNRGARARVSLPTPHPKSNAHSRCFGSPNRSAALIKQEISSLPVSKNFLISQFPCLVPGSVKIDQNGSRSPMSSQCFLLLLNDMLGFPTANLARTPPSIRTHQPLIHGQRLPSARAPVLECQVFVSGDDRPAQRAVVCAPRKPEDRHATLVRFPRLSKLRSKNR